METVDASVAQNKPDPECVRVVFKVGGKLAESLTSYVWLGTRCNEKWRDILVKFAPGGVPIEKDVAEPKDPQNFIPVRFGPKTIVWLPRDDGSSEDLKLRVSWERRRVSRATLRDFC